MLTHAASTRRSRILALVGVAALAATSIAAAQQGKSAGSGTPPPSPTAPAPTITTLEDDVKIKPPVPAPPRNEASDVLGIVFAAALGALALGVNMIPGRRGHQD